MQETHIFTEEEIAQMHKQIGENVAKLREQKGLTQLQLANAMGYASVSMVATAEIGYNNKHFNIEHLYKIAKILDIDMCNLLNTEK